MKALGAGKRAVRDLEILADVRVLAGMLRRIKRRNSSANSG